MKKVLIFAIILAVIVLGAGIYFAFIKNNNQSTILPSVAEPSSTSLATTSTNGLADYIGQASEVIGNLPTSSRLAIGTSGGTVQVINFYLSDPPVIDGGYVIVKQAQEYIISYDPVNSDFWIGISATPFTAWQLPAEQDFLATLGISEADACKLSVTVGAIYSPGNPFDGESLPLNFCSGGAFQ